MAVQRMPVDPDAGIPDLISRLGDDSKRLVMDEVHLAKLEVRESISRAARGALRLGIAFGVGVVALVALTLLLATLIGRISAGHMWIGAAITGVVELAIAIWLITRGLAAFKEPSYTLEQTRKVVLHRQSS
jgi:uncharacterized membrane protein YqjE